MQPPQIRVSEMPLIPSVGTEDYSLLLSDAQNFTEIPTLDNYTDPWSNCTTYEDFEFKQLVYKYGIPPMLIFCTLSLIVNIRVLSSVYWIRRPLSPTLYISLSLAGADAFTSAMIVVTLVINSYIPIVLDVSTGHLQCVSLSLEVVRLSGMIITVAHLLALAGNHYLGILRPLHYASIVTHRHTTILLVILWVVPFGFFTVYFFSMEGDGFRTPECKFDFMVTLKFRIIFSSLLFTPLLTMLGIYTHILIIVRREQALWMRLARSGSAKSRGTRSRNKSCGANREHQQMTRNVKAVHTTLFILGSFVIGWMPATVTFCLICDNCVFTIKEFNCKYRYSAPIIFYMNSLFIIMKTLANPIIYAARMSEIKDATSRMQDSLCRYWCRRHNRDEWSRESQQRLTFYSGCGSLRGSRNRTTVRRLTSNSASPQYNGSSNGSRNRRPSHHCANTLL